MAAQDWTVAFDGLLVERWGACLLCGTGTRLRRAEIHTVVDLALLVNLCGPCAEHDAKRQAVARVLSQRYERRTNGN